MKIEKNIPIPEKTSNANRGAKQKFLFGDMEVGDSFIITQRERLSVYSCIHYYNRTKGTSIKIRTGKDGDGSLRCWRIE